MLSANVTRDAGVIFKYLGLGHRPAAADLMLVFGTNDTRVASFAADLFHQGLAPTVLITGGMAHQHDLLATNWDASEAEVFADIMIARGVSRDTILLETEAMNTAENVRFARRIVEARGLEPRRLLSVVKPFMQRRVAATHVVEWPEMPVTITTWDSTFEDYCTADLTMEKVTNIMMGDLQRIWIYARRGFSAPQRIPAEVSEAFARLKESGFTRHLLPDE